MNTKDISDKELDKLISEFDEYPEPVDNLSTHVCDSCGARLTVPEFEEYESFCEDCMYQDTSGLIDDVDLEEESDE